MLVIPDTANSAEEIGNVLGNAYSELFTFIGLNGLKPEKVMAFYHSYHPPFIFDAGVEINRTPFTLTGRIRARTIEGGHALIAHYQGPYESVDVAYTAIGNWLKEHNKQSKGQPFEVYLNDPAHVKDSSELLTDVYQLIR
ncbi:MAG TPA: GyrI-like domain-containing protein [Chitinophagaceae bacterium]